MIYLHLTAETKKNQELIILESDPKLAITSSMVQTLTADKLPIVFHNVPVFSGELRGDVVVKDTQQYYTVDAAIQWLAMKYEQAVGLIQSDIEARYFMEECDEAVVNTRNTYDRYYKYDRWLKPPMSAYTRYDMWIGGHGLRTPLRFHTHTRFFMLVISGIENGVRVKMTPWRSYRWLEPIYDYEHYEYRSPINIWEPQTRKWVEVVEDKVQWVECELFEGDMLYIPAYWWYSIEYGSNREYLNPRLAIFTYNNIANLVVNAPANLWSSRIYLQGTAAAASDKQL